MLDSRALRLGVAFALGAAVLSALATVERLALGFPVERVLARPGFVVPVLAGGLGALALAWFVERLRASEDRYRIVADLATEMIFWRLPGGRLRYVSPSARALTGWSAEELVADPGLLERMVHPEDRELLANHRHAVGPNGKVGRVDFRMNVSCAGTKGLDDLLVFFKHIGARETNTTVVLRRVR